jgi:hypothetical protein
MKMKTTKIFLLLVLCFIGGTVLGQSKGARVSVTLTSIKVDTVTAFDGEDVHYSTINKNGKFNFIFKPGKGPREVMLTASGPERRRLAIFLDDYFNLAIVTNMLDTATYKGTGENEARVFDKNYWHSLKAWRAITGKGRTATDMYNDFHAMFSTPLRVLEENKNKVSPSFYKHHYNFLFYQQLGYPIIIGT